ncbi:MAG: hypothetical protein ACREEV_15015 [Dongiaceae bacterium]|jgi:uncharacterized protein YjiS (DUF1127 family)
MTQTAELCSPCDRPSSAPFRIGPFLARLLARFPRRRDTIDPRRMSRYLLRDIGLSE